MAAAHPALSASVLERPLAPRAPRDACARFAGIAVALVVHAVLIAALLQYAPVRRALLTGKPIMVSVVVPPAPSPASLAEPPAKPKAALPARTVRSEPRGPAPAEKMAAPPPVVAESAAVSPVTSSITEPPPTPLAQAAVAPEPAQVVPPRYNADYLQNPAPAYPPLARRMHEQGKVLIRVLVSVDGMPERIELKASSGYARLDRAALETIRGWKFVPARQGNDKVAAWVVVPVTFSLDG